MQCVEIANSFGDVRFQTILFNMAKTWNNIAVSQDEKALLAVDGHDHVQEKRVVP